MMVLNFLIVDKSTWNHIIACKNKNVKKIDFSME